MQNNTWDTAFARKKEILETAARTLKMEFVGLDNVIDSVMDAVNPWFLFPEIQEKPVIINLWGLTGTGKTSLVKRLTQLIDFQERTFRFDMGEAMDDKWALRNSLDEVFDYDNGQPMVLLMDEFQHARTLDDDGAEISHAAGRIVWELLDSGKFSYSNYISGLYELIEIERNLRRALALVPIRVENGLVVEGAAAFKRALKNESTEGADTATAEPFPFLTEEVRNTFYQTLKSKFENRAEFDAYVSALTVDEAMNLIHKILKTGYAQAEIDCSKALIIVAGNLDEAYTMSGDFNPDMEADDFYQQSLKIKITHIKHVLKKRFRNEQIARLGNIHVVYPALSSLAYRTIIRQELDKISQRVKGLSGVNFVFDASVEDMVYRDSVFPTQGTRPVFASLHHLVKSQVAKFLVFQKMELPEWSHFSVCFSEGALRLSHAGAHHVYAIPVKVNLLEDRKEKRDDMQAVTAVHESGHVVLSALLMRRLPLRAFSQTLDVYAQGFVWMEDEDRILCKKDLLAEAACYLGGLAAEKLVFGDEYISFGGEDDLQRASRWILQALRKSGMGEYVGEMDAYQPQGKTNFTIHNVKLEETALAILEQARGLAEDTLTQNRTLLLRMSGVLAEKRSMEKAEMLSLIQAYTTNEAAKHEDYFGPCAQTPFRRMLKDALLELDTLTDASTENRPAPAVYSVNKNK